MATRTRLTTPPGRDPDPDVARQPDRDRYSPGLALPREPRPPGRHRRLTTALSVLLVVVALGAVWFQVATRGQSQDPSLAPPAAPSGSTGEASPAG